MSVDIGSAWMSVLPTAKGFGAELSRLINPQMSVAGLEAGKLFGGKIAKGIEATSIVGAAAAVVGGLFKAGSTFNAMEDTIRVGTGKTGAALQALVTDATNVGKQVPAAFGDIGTALTGVNTRLGLTGTTLETVTKQFLEAGRITKEPLDLKTATGALTVFGIKGAATVGAMDSLFQVSQKTGASMNNLTAAMSSGAPVLQRFGLGWKDSAAFLGVMNKAGLDTETTIMALKMGLTKFADEHRNPEAALKATVAQMEALNKAGKTTAEVDFASKIFGSRGGPAFVAAVNSGKIALDGMFASVHAGKDTIIEVGKETQHFSEQMAMFKENVLITIKPAADAAFASLTSGMKWLNTNGVPYLKDVSHWLADNKTWLVATVKPLGEVYLAWKALLIVESVSKAMLGFIAVGKSGLGIAVLYRAAMTAQMDAQMGVAASTTAVAIATNAATLDTDALIMSEARLGFTSGATAIAQEGLAAANGAVAISAGLGTRAMVMIDTAAAAAAASVGISVALIAADVWSLSGEIKKSKKDWLDWAAIFGEGGVVGGVLAKLFGGKGKSTNPFTITPKGPQILQGPGDPDAAAAANATRIIAANTAAQKKIDDAARIADAKIVAANLKIANADKVAAAAAKAIAAAQAKIQLLTSVEDQKKIMQDFARWIGTDLVTSFADSSKKAADIIGGIMGQVGSAITGHAATISDPVKAASFTLGATKISNKLETDLFGFQTKLDDINKARTDLVTQIADADSALKSAITTRNDAASSISKLLSTPFGTPSELTKAFSGVSATADTILSGYDNLVKLVNDRFTSITGPNKDYLLTFLKDQTTRLIALVAQRGSIADKLKLAQTDLDNAITIKTSYADSLSSSLKSAGSSLSEFVTSVTLADGRIVSMTASPSTLIAAFAKRLTAIKTFATNVQSLAARGLGQDIIDQITGMGADSGGALAASLTNASDAQIAALQVSSVGIADIAKTLGKSLSDTFYSNGVNAAMSIRDGLQSQQDGIDMQMTSIMGKMIDKLAPLVDGMSIIGKDAAQGLLDSLKGKDAELLGWADGIGAGIEQRIADALRSLNTLTGGNNFGVGVIAANEAAAKLQKAADDAAAKAKADADAKTKADADAKAKADANAKDLATRSETDARNAADARAAAAAQLAATKDLIAATNATTQGVINKLRAMGVMG